MGILRLDKFLEFGDGPEAATHTGLRVGPFDRVKFDSLGESELSYEGMIHLQRAIDDQFDFLFRRIEEIQDEFKEIYEALENFAALDLEKMIRHGGRRIRSLAYKNISDKVDWEPTHIFEGRMSFDRKLFIVVMAIPTPVEGCTIYRYKNGEVFGVEHPTHGWDLKCSFNESEVGAGISFGEAMTHSDTDIRGFSQDYIRRQEEDKNESES